MRTRSDDWVERTAASSGQPLWMALGGGSFSRARQQLLPLVIGVSKVVPASLQLKTIGHGEFSVTVLSDAYPTIATRVFARNASEGDTKAAIGVAGDVVKPPCNSAPVLWARPSASNVGAGPHDMPGAGRLRLHHWSQRRDSRTKMDTATVA